MPEEEPSQKPMDEQDEQQQSQANANDVTVESSEESQQQLQSQTMPSDHIVTELSAEEASIITKLYIYSQLHCLTSCLFCRFVPVVCAPWRPEAAS